MLLVITLGAISGAFGQASKKAQGASGSKLQVLTMSPGGKAFVRIKEFTASEGETQTFRFGDVVKLESKGEGGLVFWEVSNGKGGPKSWVPEYLLTPYATEIELLRRKGCIPKSMTYVYEDHKDDGTWDSFQHGRVHLPGTPIVTTITDHKGVDISGDGSSQVAFVGNATVFDRAVFWHQEWALPMIFSDGKSKVRMAPGLMFYCTSDSRDGTFQIIELPKGVPVKKSKH